MHFIKFLLKQEPDRACYATERYDPSKLDELSSSHWNTTTAKFEESKNPISRHSNYTRTHEKIRRSIVLKIVKNVALPVLLGHYFIDETVRESFAGKRKIDPYSSRPARILMKTVPSNDNGTPTGVTVLTDSSLLAVRVEEEAVMSVVRPTIPQPISQKTGVNVYKTILIHLLENNICPRSPAK